MKYFFGMRRFFAFHLMRPCLAAPTFHFIRFRFRDRRCFHCASGQLLADMVVDLRFARLEAGMHIDLPGVVSYAFFFEGFTGMTVGNDWHDLRSLWSCKDGANRLGREVQPSLQRRKRARYLR